MPKKLISIPAGNLMRVAESKGFSTMSALKEKTGVDRKTLRAINAGLRVKETTLQSIADKLRIPLAHLVGATSADAHQVSIGGEYHYREITVQRLDAAGLRRMAETGEITWLLKIDQVTDEVEALLLRLQKSLEGWCGHEVEMTFSPPEQINLIEQIARVKTSVDIDSIVEEFAGRKLSIYGGTYVYWRKEEPKRDPNDDYHPVDPTLKYNSRHKAALCIAPEGKSISTIQVATGYEPPQEFDECKLTDIDFVRVDYRVVWSRKRPEKLPRPDRNEEVPF